ncbi:MAG: lysophospholipid acyltransferase family protein [Nautiliaceae bacterium]
MYYLFRFFYFLASLKLLSKFWWFFYLIDFKRKPIVKKNISIAFPEKSQKEKIQIAKKTYKNFLSFFEDIIYFYKNPKKLESIEVTGEKYLLEAINSKKPVILMTAHFGNWEIASKVIYRKYNFKMAAIMREFENPKINSFFKKVRGNENIKLINKKHSSREIIKALIREKRILAVLIDQRTSNKQAPIVDFFVPTKFNPAVSKLAKATKAVVIPVFSYKKEGKYILEFKKPREFKNTTIEEFTQWQADVIKEMIINYPDQYYWFHDRWRVK